MVKATRFSFGGTAAVVTSMALIMGLQAAAATRPAIVSGLLIVAVADNLSDSLSIHMYQESESLEPKAAFRSTVTNFATRLLATLAFILLVVSVPRPLMVPASIAWGLGLLVILSFFIARQRGQGPISEAFKHVLAAAVIIGISRTIGAWIPAHLR